MKFLLIAVNAKYIHTNLAVHGIKSYANHYGGYTIPYKEYTINQDMSSVLYDLYTENSDAYFFSMYIWNHSFVKSLVQNLHKLRPNAQIFLGGPEATYNADFFYENLPFLSGIIMGEGEKTFLELLQTLGSNSPLNEVKGLRLYSGDTPVRPPLDMDKLVFPYDSPESFTGRILYYESMRGCPFSCSYCLSSVEKGVRVRSLDLVFEDLLKFLKAKPRQVKFVDRTFNCMAKRARDIWKFLIDNDNGYTNFHFEMAGDLIDEESLQLLSAARPELFQFEIGVQSTNENTLESIQRSSGLSKLKENIQRLCSPRNIHLHLDLIAGLPFEDMQSFKQSFNWVHSLKPHQLQLGFLKVLGGSKMATDADSHGIIYDSDPPYQVLATNWLSFEELTRLGELEYMVDSYYNSGRYNYTLDYLMDFFPSAFDFFEKLAVLYGSKKTEGPLSKIAYYDILGSLAQQQDIPITPKLKASCRLDIALHEKPKKYPLWADKSATGEEKDFTRGFYGDPANKALYFEDYSDMGFNQLTYLTHLEFLPFNPDNMSDTPTIVLMDYKKRDITGSTIYTIVGDSLL